MNRPTKRVPSHHLQPVPGVDGDRGLRISRSSISYRVGYINNLPTEVCVGLRSGINFCLPRDPSFDSTDLIVAIDFEISAGMRDQVEHFLSAVDDSYSAELKLMKDLYIKESKVKRQGPLVLRLNYPISLHQIKAFGGSVYLSEVDVVVSLSGLRHMPPHPFSQLGVFSNMVAESPLVDDEHKFAYIVEIIDNAGVQGDRFLNIHNRIYRIKPKRDDDKRDGIYLVTNKPSDGADSISEIVATKIDPDRAEESLGLFKTYEAAVSLGDVGLIQKQRLVSMENDLVEKKARLLQDKAAVEERQLAKETELKERELELDEQARQAKLAREAEDHEINIGRMRSKDYYEEKSFVRKDGSEVLKMLPGIVMGVGALFIAFGKFFGPAKA